MAQFLTKLFGNPKDNVIMLKWLAYAVIVIMLFVVGTVSGLLPLTLMADPSYLSWAILIFYAFAEIYSVRVHYLNNQEIHDIPTHPIIKADIHIIERALEHRNSFLHFAIYVLITMGLFGTIVGICLTVWPFLALHAAGTALTIANMQPLFGKVFAGAGAALIPSAYSILLSLILSFNARLADNSVEEIVLELEANASL